MPTTWTRLHEYLGERASTVTFEMVERVAAMAKANTNGDNMERDDLDWKVILPVPPEDGAWNEFCKDVAAMANTRGGVLVYGVSDQGDIPGIDPAEVDERKYRQWLGNHIQPYLDHVDIRTIASADGTKRLMLVQVPASELAPHACYGTASRDKKQMAAVVPYRQGADTQWMAEHQVARAYRERFNRHERYERDLAEATDYAAEFLTVDDARNAPWLLMALKPQRPAPAVLPPLSEQDATELLSAARMIARELVPNYDHHDAFSSFRLRPSLGLRCWVTTNQPRTSNDKSFGAYVETHHDGTVVLGVDVAPHSMYEVEAPPPVLKGAVESAAGVAVAFATTVRAIGRSSGPVGISARIATNLPQLRLVHSFFNPPSRMLDAVGRTIHRLRPLLSELPADSDRDVERSVVADLAAGVLNQFGVQTSLTRIASTAR